MPSLATTDNVHFVIGTGRGGSTLLHEILCRHPDVRFVSNITDRTGLHLINRWNATLYRRLPASVTQKGRLRFAPSEAYRALAREVSPMLANSHRDLVATDATPWLQDRLRTFFERGTAEQHGSVLLHKFTGWPRAGLLRRTFPGAKFVHVVRDGRAVVNSWLQMYWWAGYQGPSHWQWGDLPDSYYDEWQKHNQSFVALAGLAWMRLLDAAEEARRRFPADDWLDIRYEDLVQSPGDVLTRACEFLRLEPRGFIDDILRIYRFDPTRSDAFHSDLGVDDVALLTQMMKLHLRAHGYGDYA